MQIGFEIVAAKIVDENAPSSSPMAPRGGQRTSPSTDQLKVRRQIQRQQPSKVNHPSQKTGVAQYGVQEGSGASARTTWHNTIEDAKKHSESLGHKDWLGVMREKPTEKTAMSKGASLYELRDGNYYVVVEYADEVIGAPAGYVVLEQVVDRSGGLAQENEAGFQRTFMVAKNLADRVFKQRMEAEDRLEQEMDYAQNRQASSTNRRTARPIGIDMRTVVERRAQKVAVGPVDDDETYTDDDYRADRFDREYQRGKDDGEGPYGWVRDRKRGDSKTAAWGWGRSCMKCHNITPGEKAPAACKKCGNSDPAAFHRMQADFDQDDLGVKQRGDSMLDSWASRKTASTGYSASYNPSTNDFKAMQLVPDAVRPFDGQELLRQIGGGNIMAISGGRRAFVTRIETGQNVADKETVGLYLPSGQGYGVLIWLDASDTYTVARTRRGAINGQQSNVYADQVGEAAYQASCYNNGKFGSKTAAMDRFPNVTDAQAEKFVQVASRIGYDISRDDAFDILLLSGGYKAAMFTADVVSDVANDIRGEGELPPDDGWGISTLIETTDYLNWVFNRGEGRPTKAECEKMLGMLRTETQKKYLRSYIQETF